MNISCEFVRPGGKEGDELIGIGEVVQMGEHYHLAGLSELTYNATTQQAAH